MGVDHNIFYVFIRAPAGPDPRRAPGEPRALAGTREWPRAQGRAQGSLPSGARAPARPDPRRAPGGPRVPAGPRGRPREGPEPRGGPTRALGQPL